MSALRILDIVHELDVKPAAFQLYTGMCKEVCLLFEVCPVLVDALMAKRSRGLNVNVLALGRNEARARKRFPYFGEPGFSFEELDICGQGSTPSMPADVASKTFTFLLAPQTNTAAIATDDLDKEKTVTVTGNGEFIKAYKTVGN